MLYGSVLHGVSKHTVGGRVLAGPSLPKLVVACAFFFLLSFISESKVEREVMEGE